MNRHAYLILAHKNWTQLSKLVKLLDYEGNDIFIHIDKKSSFTDSDRKKVRNAASDSNVQFVERAAVSWGDYSVIEAELLLLCVAVKGGYRYYHLISGMDLPLKSQGEIHAFFDQADGKQFIQFLDEEWTIKTSTRVKYYWFLQRKVGNHKRTNLLYGIQRLFLGAQKILGVNRSRTYSPRTGAQWFSITDEFAVQLCENREFIRKRFSRTFCGDEWVIQTMAVEMGFSEACYCSEPTDTKSALLRYIDWSRGAPYTFRISDYEELMDSGCLFARKFDEKVDNKIIEKIFLNIIER